MSGKRTGEPPKSLLSRSRELLSIAAKMGSNELSGKISSLVSENSALKKLNLQIDQAQALVDGLTHLRGAAMKAGQMLSIEARDFLPPDVIEILNQLHDKSEFMSFDKVKEILIADLGVDLFNELEDLSLEPVASASIGQVHRARFRGLDVALKVQFPGVASSITADLFVLRKIADAFLSLSGKSVNLDALFQELTLLLKQEMDYISEASHMEDYARMIEKHPTYVVPRPIPELVNAHVLGMTYEGGLKPDDWIRLQPDQEQRNAFGRKILDLYVIEFFENGFVQTDPNFGNFFFRPDQNQMVLLDFGCMKHYSLDFRKKYKELLVKIRSHDAQTVLQHCYAMGWIDRRENEECCSAFIKMLQMSLEPFSRDKQPFPFASASYSSDIRKASMEFTKLIRFSAPPHQILFLHRKLSGIFRMLQALKVQIPLEDYWENFVRV